MDKETPRVLLGHITGVSGLKGWIKVHSDTNPRENIVSYPKWWIEQSGSWRQVDVTDGRPQGKTIVAQIKGVVSPEQASVLVGAAIAVDRDAMPALSASEYYWADLIGMQVRTSDDMPIGPVSRLFETGANDVMVVTDERPGKAVTGKELKEVLVPWLVPSVIMEVDLKSKTITVDWDPDF